METAHVVPMHAGTPLETAHTVPQLPHAFTLFVVATSQPFATLASQFPNPAAQAIEHAPAAQEGEPLTELHANPQEPQWATLVLLLTSHPLKLLPSQLPYGVVHDTTWHEPVEHDSVLFGRSQRIPHPPQFGIVFRLVSHPSG